MSELTPCNYCTLRRLRSSAESQGKVVTLRRGSTVPTDESFPHSISVYVHRPDEEPAEGHFSAWFAELTDHCCC